MVETEPCGDAERFAEAFAAVYLAFHRRDGKRSQLSGVSRAMLTHLSLAGPLTIGELAGHLDRAQSVVSDIVTQLEGNGLAERFADPRDRRRSLVWLTTEGVDRLARDRHVLDLDRLATALAGIPEPRRSELLAGLAELGSVGPPDSKENP